MVPLLAKILVEEQISIETRIKSLRAVNNLVNQDSSSLIKEKALTTYLC